AVGVDQLDRATALGNLCGRECQHAGIHVDADHVAWTEMALENGEGSPGAAADIDHGRIGRISAGGEPDEILDRPFEYVHRPSIGAQKPRADPGFRHISVVWGAAGASPRAYAAAPGHCAIARHEAARLVLRESPKIARNPVGGFRRCRASLPVPRPNRSA